VQQTEDLHEVAAVPIAIDETTQEPGALDRRVCDAVCLKLARGGGISGVIEQARRARAAGYEVYLASTLDGPLGIAAALHAAAAVKPDRPCGLATLDVFANRSDPLPATHGTIAAPSGPGLGDGLLDWY
jgi:L-alanine-DL-glutamate epimerase-like enolase superfamily enzyme